MNSKIENFIESLLFAAGRPLRLSEIRTILENEGIKVDLAEIRVGLPVSKLAKWKTSLQMISIGFLIIGDASPTSIPALSIGEVCLWIAALLTIWTGYDYLRSGLLHVTSESPRNNTIED